MYFIIFRRVWLVEDPLPLPGFEATLKMLDIASDVNTGAVEHARESLQTIGIWTAVTMFGLFLVEYPLIWIGDKKLALFDWIAQTLHVGDFGLATIYSKGTIHQPSGTVDGVSLSYTQWSADTAWNPFAYTYIGVYLTPSMFAIGWFMKTRVAFLVNLGTIVGWFFLVPLVVWFNFPIYDAISQANVPIQDYAGETGAALQMLAFSKAVRTIAIGAIVGGGMFGLAKMYKTFLNIFSDIGGALKGEGSQEYMEGKGWYEWPLKHIPIFMILTFFSMILIFTIGGFSILASLIFATVLIMTTFLLGAIAVRVMGETGIEPVSGTSFIVLLMLLGVFLNAQDLLDLTTQDAILLGLVGTTVFGSAISMSGTVIGDYKNSLYIGNRPYHISKGNIMGVVPGAIIGAGVAIFLSIQLADGTIELLAPQANAFATFSVIFAEKEGDLCLPMLIGGYARDRWEDKKLKPRIDKIKEEKGSTEAEKQRALILLSTFMVAAGLLTGEAFFGTESSILSFIDTLVDDPFATSWYIGRLVGFVLLNVTIGALIYWLFKRAGVIGSGGEDAILEAETA
jgi:hypothetical protein